jgi:2-methylcitrate dehydratase PrpD
MSALGQLGSVIAGSATPSAAERELVALHLMDAVGAWIAGAHTAEGSALLRFRAAMSEARPAGDALALDLATRCALARLSEIDNIHLASMTTPGGIVVPAALTLAAATPAATADDVIAAILAGTEAMIRLGRAIDGPAVLYRGIWPTYFAAPFAIAAVAARLNRLDGRATANALALALILAAPGVGHHNASTTSRWFAVGQAAGHGLTAALAAQRGFTSDLALGEGPFFSSIYGVKPDLAAFTDRPGEGTALAEVSFKPWCAARQTMAATQALREIIESGVAPAAMDEIRVSVLPPHLKMIDHGVVDGDRASYLTSLPYCMAVAAAAPEMAFEVQQAPRQVPAGVRTVMEKIKLQADESLLSNYPRTWQARVSVLTGSVPHARTVAHVPGEPARPFGRAQVRDKFKRFAGTLLGTEKAEHILAGCSGALATGEFAGLVAKIEDATQPPDRAHAET